MAPNAGLIVQIIELKTSGGTMSQSTRRFRSLAITLIMVALANIAISFAANEKGIMPVLPDTPRPKGIMPVLPDTPRPRGIMPVLPDTPRP